MTAPRPKRPQRPHGAPGEPVMETFTLPLPRWPRPPGRRRPSLRGTDRADRLALTIAVIVALLAVPVAAAVGVAVYNARLEDHAEQTRTRHSVTATVTEETTAPGPRRNTVSADVQWYWAGREHTGAARVSPTTQPGDSVQIWVDQEGELTRAPASAGGAVLDGWSVAVLLWLAIAAAAAGIAAAIRSVHATLRDAAWQRDIEGLLDD